MNRFSLPLVLAGVLALGACTSPACTTDCKVIRENQSLIGAPTAKRIAVNDPVPVGWHVEQPKSAHPIR